jgi:hypothetical protein
MSTGPWQERKDALETTLGQQQQLESENDVSLRPGALENNRRHKIRTSSEKP